MVIARDMLARLRRGGGGSSARRNRQLPHVVGFSYDSNTLGAHVRRHQRRALEAGRRIARANGRHLARFVTDFKRDRANLGTRVRLLGHSLGSEVIFHTMMYLAYGSLGGPFRRACLCCRPAPLLARNHRGRAPLRLVPARGRAG